MSITLNNLSKRYGNNLVVNNVSVEVQDGELFVLLGGSGSGKSTILRLISGLVPVDSGRIELNGRDVTHLPPQERGTGFVFQNYSIFRHMTVAENVEFGLRIRRTPATERSRRSSELLELVGLAGMGERYADQLSGGQQQRVALARALAYEPAVLLLDEPFGALDVKIRAQLRRTLRDIQQRLQVTTILVTHDQEEAFELANRIGLIERGHLVEIGTPQTLYHRPRTEFAAMFIGGGNVLVGRHENGRLCLGQVQLPLPPGTPAHDEGAPMRLLFRPETVIMQPEPFSPQQAIHTLGHGRIIEQIFSGSWQRMVLAVENLRGARPLVPAPTYGQAVTHIEAVQPSEAAGNSNLKLGQEVWLGLRQYHVLNPAGLKVLIYAEESPAGAAAAAFGCTLARAAGGPVTLLAVTGSAEEIDEARRRMEKAVLSWLPQLPQLETRVRQGQAEEILAEAQAGNFEMVVVGYAGETPGAAAGDVTQIARRLLLEAGIAVLFVPATRPHIQRVLICTAAGEPGKSDVRLGGRVARRTVAEATVFHVCSPGSTGYEQERARRHLAQARLHLEVLGVRSRLKVAEGMAVAEIAQEAEEGDYDLIVAGAPAPPARQQLLWPDRAAQIVATTNRPVLVVPMVE
jgi:sulfate/thiosulfate transport system ATP-binding protein